MQANVLHGPGGLDRLCLVNHPDPGASGLGRVRVPIQLDQRDVVLRLDRREDHPARGFDGM